jgi:hypothetical protein
MTESSAKHRFEKLVDKVLSYRPKKERKKQKRDAKAAQRGRQKT